MQPNDLYDAGRLLQWALRPDADPTRHEEYNDLIERYLDRMDFRETVDTIAAGLGLTILQGMRQGYSLVLAPAAQSVFLMPMREYRQSQNYSEEKRLLN